MTLLLTWSVQVLALVAAAALAALAVANAKARLIFWQGLLVALLLLPALEPWRSSPILVLKQAPAADLLFQQLWRRRKPAPVFVGGRNTGCC